MGIFVDVIAVKMITVSGMAARRVSKPISTSVPQAISKPPTSGARMSGEERPIFSKRPAPTSVGGKQEFLNSFREKHGPDEQPHDDDGRRTLGAEEHFHLALRCFSSVLALRNLHAAGSRNFVRAWRGEFLSANIARKSLSSISSDDLVGGKPKALRYNAMLHPRGKTEKGKQT